jgi:hypothetical protein
MAETLRKLKTTLYIGFRKTKLKRTWDSASLGGKDFKRDYAKEKLRARF